MMNVNEIKMNSNIFPATLGTIQTLQHERPSSSRHSLKTQSMLRFRLHYHSTLANVLCFEDPNYASPQKWLCSFPLKVTIRAQGPPATQRNRLYRASSAMHTIDIARHHL